MKTFKTDQDYYNDWEYITNSQLGYLKKGDKRLGEKIMSVDLLNNNTFEVEVVSPHFVDPKGEKLRV